MFKKLCLCFLIVAQFNCIQSKPFLYNFGETLINLITTASSASSISTPENSNIADLRTNNNNNKTTHNHNNNNNDDDDDFFKIPLEKEEISTTESPQQTPVFLTRKIGKILRKIQFLQQLSNPQNSNNNNNNNKDDDFDKELDDFDKEFDEDFNKNETKINIIGDKYRNDDNNNHRIVFNPSGITVFFMEAIGSIIGLVYGAAAQLNHHETTNTTTTVNSV